MNNEKLAVLDATVEKIRSITLHLRDDVKDFQTNARITDTLFRDGALTEETADEVAANFTKQLWEKVDAAISAINAERTVK